MKHLAIFLTCMALLSCNSNANKQQQASVQGDAIEDQLLLADPFILEDNGWYYIYGTHDKEGIVVYRSKDLKYWSERCGNAKNGLALHKDDVWGEHSFWAPEVYKTGNKYLMTYSAEEHICYAESDSPCGPFIQQEKRPYMEEKGIDSSIFIDEDGNAYMFWVRFSNGNVIWVAEMTPDLHEIKMETARRLIDVMDGTWEQVMERVAEGPIVIKLENKYYLTYSCNHYQSQDYAVGYAVADSPMGPYTRYAGNPILHRHCGYAGTGHHAFFKTGNQYYIVYHAHNSSREIHPRQTLIAPLNLYKEKCDDNMEQYRIEISEEIIIPLKKTYRQ